MACPDGYRESHPSHLTNRPSKHPIRSTKDDEPGGAYVRPDELREAIRRALISASDPARAPGQQAYMKSSMPFLGVPVPEVRKIARASAKGINDPSLLLKAAKQLWDDASHREERYAALALLAASPLKTVPETLTLGEHMVRTGQWWDFTDDVAHRVADAHDVRPEATAALTRAWARDENMWMRRLAIISQLGRRDRVDRALLSDVIVPNVSDPEFFIRNAIGWALRDFARVDPDWVRGFVDNHELSPLSRREALKHLS